MKNQVDIDEAIRSAPTSEAKPAEEKKKEKEEAAMEGLGLIRMKIRHIPLEE